jgi:hypothetical protein
MYDESRSVFRLDRLVLAQRSTAQLPADSRFSGCLLPMNCRLMHFQRHQYQFPGSHNAFTIPLATLLLSWRVLGAAKGCVVA